MVPKTRSSSEGEGSLRCAVREHSASYLILRVTVWPLSPRVRSLLPASDATCMNTRVSGVHKNSIL